MSDYIEFKDEMMKRIRLLENKFTSEFNNRFSQINLGFEKLDTKISTIAQNHSSLLELITKQNFDYGKINDLEEFKAKAEQELITHDIKIKNIIEDIKKLKIRYDKIISENLLVPGYVGPGGTYKNLAEYVQYQIGEFQKIRNDTEQTKNKVDNSSKNALNVINNSLAQFQKYTDEKNKDTQLMLERKYIQFNSKMLEMETELNKYQYKIEKQMKPLQKDIQKLVKVKGETPFANEKNIDNLNKKINILLEEFDLIKNNKELSSILNNYRQTNNSTELLNSKNISKYKAINNNKSNNKSNLDYDLNLYSPQKKQSQHSTKNMFMSFANEHRNSIIIRGELPNTNKEEKNFILSPQKKLSSNNNHIMKFEKFEKIDDENENRKINQKKGTVKLQDISSIIKSNPTKQIFMNGEENINYNNSVDFSVSGENVNEIEKLNKNKNSMLEISKNMIKGDKFKKISFNKNKENEKNRYIYENKGKDGGAFVSKISQATWNNNEENTRNVGKKITIDGLFKQKQYSMSDKLIKINPNNIKKNEENENILLNSVSENKKSLDKFEEKKTGTRINDNKIIEIKSNNINKNNSSKNNTNNNKNDNLNFTNNSFNNINNINIFSQTSKNSFLSKKEDKDNFIKENPSTKKRYFNLQMNVNEEQKQIMKKIRDYYKNKKIIMEKKLHQNAVDCNIINLNMNDPNDIINIKYKNSSAKSTLFTTKKSKINENRNNLREISLKLNPYFGRTSYRFFGSKEKIDNLKKISSFDKRSHSFKEKF